MWPHLTLFLLVSYSYARHEECEGGLSTKWDHRHKRQGLGFLGGMRQPRSKEISRSCETGRPTSLPPRPTPTPVTGSESPCPTNPAARPGRVPAGADADVGTRPLTLTLAIRVVNISRMCRCAWWISTGFLSGRPVTSCSWTLGFSKCARH